MNWEATGALGEILGAIAVVITIIYLSRQVRDNSRQVKLNTTQSYASLVQDAYAPVYTNRQTLTAWLTGTNNPSALDDEGRQLFLHLMDRQLNNTVPLVNHYSEGAMSKAEFQHYRQFFLALTETPGGKLWLKEREAQFETVLEALHNA